jgi:hypothetical protein
VTEPGPRSAVLRQIEIGDRVQLIDYDPWPPPAAYPYPGTTGVVIEINDDLYAVPG